ncbi:hypothetical protein [Deinococcus hopiensis]|uniref:Uncharacterized protein n=1 Tax=Deinococcus hopiensis KR-140 TaxID=695939 RepID=A0A1W1VHI4_9DEIO|nr:hypothetical protein [Deinococcus hopiensis]SMB92837.1 hypothetical protein SAMN00790413_01743 [Deinococcus hopiensis KR-140]
MAPFPLVGSGIGLTKPELALGNLVKDVVVLGAGGRVPNTERLSPSTAGTPHGRFLVTVALADVE